MAGMFEGCAVCIYDTEGVLLENTEVREHNSTNQTIEVSYSSDLQNGKRCEVLILAAPSPYAYSGVIHINGIRATISLYKGKKKENRCAVRYSLSGRVVISSYLCDNKPYRLHKPMITELVNISTRGVRLKAKLNALSIGDRFIFHIKIGDSTKTLLAEVMNFSDNEEQESAEYGCALVGEGNG